ncbi:MAG: hypothetical protein HYX91_06260 [Chloroflexi bacterium]|nr:hypothetical protein [Chloroflexota bacterium]
MPTAAAVVIMPAVFAAGDQFQVAGSGFAPGEAVEIAILNATPEKNIYFGGGFRASDTGAFFAPVLPRDDYAAVVDKGGSALMLPRLSPGVYTLTVKGLNGSMATAPLVIIEKAK